MVALLDWHTEGRNTQDVMRLEAAGCVLWKFDAQARGAVERVADVETHYFARLPNGEHVNASCCSDFDAHRAAQRAVIERCKVELAKRRTPVHVEFFKRLERPLVSPPLKIGTSGRFEVEGSREHNTHALSKVLTTAFASCNPTRDCTCEALTGNEGYHIEGCPAR